MPTAAETSVIQLKSDIEQLEKQKKILQADIDAKALQTEEFYKKRQQAAQEAEAIQREIETSRKKITEDKEKLHNAVRDHENKELQLKIATEKLNQLKAEFANERRHYEVKQKELTETEKEILVRKESVQKREDSVRDREEELSVREDAFQRQIKGVREELEREINENKSAKVAAKQAAEDAERVQKECLKTKHDLEAQYAEKVKQLESVKENNRIEIDSQKEHLRKRELGIVQREKELDNAKLEYKTKIEDFEIEKARWREEHGIKEDKKKKK